MEAPVPDLVTVVVPARNEEGTIGACLDSILAQEYADLEVIVVDGGSTDRTLAVVAGYQQCDQRVRLLHNPQRVIPRSLNLALRSARGKWFVRVDAHAQVPPEYVRRAVVHLHTGRWAGVGGRKDGVGITPAGHAIAAAMGSRFGVGNSTYHHGIEAQEVEHIPFGAYPVHLARRLGGWDERLTVNQDFEFDHRVRQSGGRLLFDPDMVIRWRCRQSVTELYGQYRRYGRGKVVVARLHPASVRPRHLAAPTLLAVLVVASVLGWLWPIVAAAAFGAYGTGVAVATVMTSPVLRQPGSRRWLAPAFVAMHVGWGLGFWEGLLGRRPRPMRAAAVHAA